MARGVARIIALALDLEADFFDKPEMLGNPIATLRLLHYEGGNRIVLPELLGAKFFIKIYLSVIMFISC